MQRIAFQIQLADSVRAAEAFDVFPPGGLDYVESWIRRRDGDSQFILVELADGARESDFRQLCTQFSGVVDVRDISEDECRRRCKGGTTG
jgi:hypothetical protein